MYTSHHKVTSVTIDEISQLPNIGSWRVSLTIHDGDGSHEITLFAEDRDSLVLRKEGEVL